jgi:hypothetical protein
VIPCPSGFPGARGPRHASRHRFGGEPPPAAPLSDADVVANAPEVRRAVDEPPTDRVRDFYALRAEVPRADEDTVIGALVLPRGVERC